MTPHLADTPVLTTKRLTLRAPHPGDAHAFVAFYATDRAKYVGGPMEPRQAWNFFGTELGHWVMNGFGMFTVTRTGDDTPLGIVGHWYPDGWPEKEVGWVLFDATHEGQGIAKEAAIACIDHAWSQLGWTTIVSYIDLGNDPSVALAKSLGATRPGRRHTQPGQALLRLSSPNPKRSARMIAPTKYRRNTDVIPTSVFAAFWGEE